ncbi:hypothetical protein PtA15_8A621 [Puccinia triticina]|uniref:Uncharacterized protein n=1 Tax=Puccinia triticina TaxID=208348 RepID=A0ABY7CRR1_9BASI|nr:uncharacterized protein PtA15_8A621 [Puccinia triticina]WAQ87715.1 hypothetical protein PtA15_8A621 [Puccinia triticina]
MSLEAQDPLPSPPGMSESQSLEKPPTPMPPPPERTYQSQKALYDDAQAWAKAHGYAIICARSNVNEHEQRYTYQCDRSGKNDYKLFLHRVNSA